MLPTLFSKRHRGVSLIEILVTLVIVTLGLLGLVGMQSKLQTSEMEAYQRSQALLLLNDMASRLSSNRTNAAAYATGAPVTAPLGAGMTCPTTNTTLVQRDLAEWCQILQGAGEILATTTNVGALLGGRGCVEASGSEYRVTVAWQGLTPLSSATATDICGGGTTYDGATGSNCTENRCRRSVMTVVRIGTL